MKNKPKKNNCAVLLAVYNGMNFIYEQIQSILNQTNVCITVFVSVDLSSDGSEGWLDALAAQDPRVVVLPHGKQFGGASKNFFHLIRNVNFESFDYIAFADQDDCWFPDKLSRATKILNETDYDAYSGNVISFWPDGRRKLINKAQSQKKWDFIFEAAAPGCTYVMKPQLMKAIKKRIIEAWEEVQQVSFHDWFCYAFARSNNYRWFIDPNPYLFYRQHGKNQIGVNDGLKAYLSRFKKIKEGWWLSQATLISHLVGGTENGFTKRWSNLGRVELLRLATHAFQCRRKSQDVLFFFIICVVLACTTVKKKSAPLLTGYNNIQRNIKDSYE